MIEFLSVAQSVRDQEMHREADDANTSVSVAIEDCTDEPPNSVRRLYQDLDEELRANVLNGSIFRIRNLPQRISAYGHNIDDGLPSCSTCTPLTKAILNNKGSLLGAIIQRTSEAPRTCYIHTARHEQGLVQLATRFLQEPRYLCAVLKFAFDHGLSWSGFDLSPLHIALFRKRTGDLKILLAHASKTISEPAGSSHHEQTREQNELEYMRTLSAVYPGDSREGLTGQQQKSLSLILDQLSEPIYDENMDLTHPVMEVSATPLHYAAAIGLCKGVKLLLEWGADKNCPDEHGRTALIWASKGGYFDIARILVDAGANAAIYDQFARNAISYAIEFGSVEIIEILTMQGGQALYGGIFDTPDLLAYSPNVKTFQNLVDRGLDPHVTDPSERSGLSCFLERTRCWPYLLMSCLWSSATNLEITDMIDTATINNDDMTRKLCKARSASCYLDLNRCFEGEGRSPLCVAALIDSTRMVKTLLDFGANINFDGSPYGSALLAACYHGRHEIVKLLVREGAAMQYISPAGEYRNAFEAAQAHPNIVRWFLVERFLEQRRLTSESAGQDVPLKCWSGIAKGEFPLTGKYEWYTRGSRLEFLIWTTELRQSFRGKVVIHDQF
ncbi:ankyrin repeat-containing domain protein [Xylariomycetidae sp. FL0641]|nr:ankyrin repeat-containing domain protein [Xylariomycetidae sp. FL0641]